MKQESGLTIIELMISVLLSSIVIGGAFAVGQTMQSQYREHREGAAAEQAARVSLELVADALRGAGAGVRPGVISDGGLECNAAIRVITNVAAGRDIGELHLVPGSDVLDVITPSGGLFTTLAETFDNNTAEMVVTSGAGFSKGDYALVVDLDKWGALVHLSDDPTETTLAAEPINIGGCAAAPTFYPAGSLVIRARSERYFVATTDENPTPALYVDRDTVGEEFTAEPLAPGIEDLQVAVAIDVDVDGEVLEVGAAGNDDEWYGNASGDDDPPAIIGGAAWRAVRISLSARTEEPLIATPAYQRPPLGDHVGQTSLDPYRRRVLSTQIELRNLTGSP